MTVLLITTTWLFTLYALWVMKMISLWSRPSETPTPIHSSSHLSLIIPYRNEAQHLPNLLAALSIQLKQTPGAALLFVDDHSTDESNKLIQAFAATHANSVMLSQRESHGKKQGIDLAISSTKTPWIITLDADVIPCDGWLSRIASWTHENASDLLILPLHIGPSNSIVGRLQEVEFASVMGVTAGMALLKRPILCNGANMCFQREAYLRVRDERADMHITSGDDLFLLHALIPHQNIAWVHDPQVRVSTAPQSSWSTLVAQRLRWMGKTSSISNRNLTATAWLTFLTNGVWIVCAFLTLFNRFPFAFFAGITILKIVLDGWLIVKVGRWMCIKRLKRFYLALVFLYPFYATLFPLISQLVKPTWKGRPTTI